MISEDSLFTTQNLPGYHSPTAPLPQKTKRQKLILTCPQSSQHQRMNWCPCLHDHSQHFTQEREDLKGLLSYRRDGGGGATMSKPEAYQSFDRAISWKAVSVGDAEVSEFVTQTHNDSGCLGWVGAVNHSVWIKSGQDRVGLLKSRPFLVMSSCS